MIDNSHPVTVRGMTPDDVQAVVHDVFRHRIIVSFEAEAIGIDADQILDTLVQRVAAA